MKEFKIDKKEFQFIKTVDSYVLKEKKGSYFEFENQKEFFLFVNRLTDIAEEMVE